MNDELTEAVNGLDGLYTFKPVGTTTSRKVLGYWSTRWSFTTTESVSHWEVRDMLASHVLQPRTFPTERQPYEPFPIVSGDEHTARDVFTAIALKETK